MTEEKKSFEIKDRRAFSGEESAGASDEPRPETPQAAASAHETGASASSAETQPGTGASQPLPKIDFSTFVISLNASVLVHLGIIDDPASGQKYKNLPMAKQTIDTLNMLQEKTRGNLSADEEGMLKNILYDLRIMYVREKG